MRAFIAAAALLAGSATIAYAQDQTQPAPEPMEEPAPAAEQPMAPEQPMPSTQPMSQPMAPMASTSVAPGNTAPERDSRGIAVMSDPAMAPAGTNQAPAAGSGPMMPNPNQAAAFATQPSTGEKPPCSRTVTDNCTQTYETGRRGRRR